VPLRNRGEWDSYREKGFQSKLLTGHVSLIEVRNKEVGAHFVKRGNFCVRPLTEDVN